jgi:hypothetical protein
MSQENTKETLKATDIESVLKLLQQANRDKLQPDILDKITKFAGAIKSRQIAKGYAADLSSEDLLEEIIHHVANWHPSKINCDAEKDRQEVALSVAWKTITNGKWFCPHSYNQVAILEREHQAYRNKINQDGYEPKDWVEHCEQIDALVRELH